MTEQNDIISGYDKQDTTNTSSTEPESKTGDNAADEATMRSEEGFRYTVASYTKELNPEDRATANFLTHRMIWDLQEKMDMGDRVDSKDDTLEVEEDVEIR